MRKSNKVHWISFLLGVITTAFTIWALKITVFHNSFASRSSSSKPSSFSSSSSSFSISPPITATFCPRGTNPLSNVFAGLNNIFPKNQLIIDVGAFDGSDSIQYAKSGHRVLSFEPSPSKISRIVSNFVREGVTNQVQLYEVALGNQDTIRKFQVSDAIDPTEMKFMGPHHGSAQDSFAVPWTKNVRTVNVRVRRLDDVLDELGERNVLMLKIDAQGFDFEVLQGADRLISEHRARIVTFEFAPGLMPRKLETANSLLRFLHQRGYHCSMCGGGTSRDGSQAPLLSVDSETYISTISSTPFYYRGVNHGAWDNLVCMY